MRPTARDCRFSIFSIGDIVDFRYFRSPIDHRPSTIETIENRQSKQSKIENPKACLPGVPATGRKVAMKANVPTPRLLIADDQADVREALRLLVKGEGYQCQTAN